VADLARSLYDFAPRLFQTDDENLKKPEFAAGMFSVIPAKA